MSLQTATNVGDITYSRLNEPSDRVFMDTLVTFKHDDYCPLFDDDFDPVQKSPFVGEIFKNPHQWDELDACDSYFYDELESKLAEMARNFRDENRGVSAEIEADREIAAEILDEVGYNFSRIYGVPTGKTLENGQPEIRYSLDKSADSKIYGFCLTEDSRSDDIAKMFIDRANGKDIELHAVKVYDVKSDKDHEILKNADISFNDMQGQAKDDAVFDFVEGNGQFIPASELKDAFVLARVEDLKEQVKEGKRLANLPDIVQESPALCAKVVANNPMDIYKIKPEMITENFMRSVITDMSTRKNEPDHKKQMWKLLTGVGDVKHELFSFAAAEAIFLGSVTGRDLGLDKITAKDVYRRVIEDNPKLLNNGEHNGTKLSDIPVDILTSPEVINAIAKQMTPYFSNDAVKIENLPKVLQDNPIILGRGLSNSLDKLNSVPPHLKENPEFLKALFSPLRRHQTPKVFNELYGGIEKAPEIAKELAVSTVYLNGPDVMPILEATFGKQELNEMIMKGQKDQFGHEKGFMYNTSKEGRMHLMSADLTMNAKGEISELKMRFDNGYVEPDGDHGGWQSSRSYSHKDFWLEKPEIRVPTKGCDFAKGDIKEALGGVEPKTAWTPWYDRENEKQKDITRQMSRDDGRQMRG